MSLDVFLSYARKDQQLAEALFAELKAQGLDVWWDFGLLPGDDFAEKILEYIEVSRLTVVLWTETSVTSRWVRSEAEVAYQKGTLFPVVIDSAQVPLPFSRYHAVLLTSEDGNLDLTGTALQIVAALEGKQSDVSVDQAQEETERQAVMVRDALEKHADASTKIQSGSGESEAGQIHQGLLKELEPMFAHLSKLEELSPIRTELERANARDKLPKRITALLGAAIVSLAGIAAILTYVGISPELLSNYLGWSEAEVVREDEQSNSDSDEALDDIFDRPLVVQRQVEAEEDAETQQASKIEKIVPPLNTFIPFDHYYYRYPTISQDGRLMAIADKSWNVNVYYVQSGELVTTFSGHEATVQDIEFFSDPDIVASAAEDGTVRVWSIPERRQLALLRDYEGNSRATSLLSVSADDSLIAVGGKTDRIVVYRWETREVVAELTTDLLPPIVESERTSKSLALSPERAKELREIADRQRLKSDSERSGFQPIEDIEFTTSGTGLAVVSHKYAGDVFVFPNLSMESVRAVDMRGGFDVTPRGIEVSNGKVLVIGTNEVGYSLKKTFVTLFGLPIEGALKEIFRTEAEPASDFLLRHFSISEDGKRFSFSAAGGARAIDLETSRIFAPQSENCWRTFLVLVPVSPEKVVADACGVRSGLEIQHSPF